MYTEEYSNVNAFLLFLLLIYFMSVWFIGLATEPNRGESLFFFPYTWNFFFSWLFIWSFPCGSAGKESACNVGDLGSIPGLGRFSGESIGYPLQYSGLENSMDCIVYGVAKSWTWLSDFHSLAFIWSKIGWPHISALSAKRDIWKHEKEESVYPIGYLINNHILTTILKEINPEYSLEGLMLQLKLQ